MYAQVDDEGCQYAILEEIIDCHKNNSAILISKGMKRSVNGPLKPKVTTQGWELLCCFKDGLLCWVALKDLNNPTLSKLPSMQAVQSFYRVALKDLKNSNIIEVAEYAVVDQLVKEPTF